MRIISGQLLLKRYGYSQNVSFSALITDSETSRIGNKREEGAETFRGVFDIEDQAFIISRNDFLSIPPHSPIFPRPTEGAPFQTAGDRARLPFARAEEESQKHAGPETHRARKNSMNLRSSRIQWPRGNECGSFTRVNGSLPFLGIRARCTWSAHTYSICLPLSRPPSSLSLFLSLALVLSPSQTQDESKRVS